MFFIVSMLYIPALASGIDNDSLEGVPSQHVVDFNGDGKTDWVVIRQGGGPTSPATWLIQENSNNAPTTFFPWGWSTDFFVPEDYDGDNKTDFAVWRPGVAGRAAWYVLQSQTGTVRAENFGQTGDDPTVVGDYDGDNKADLAVYRQGIAGNDRSFWFYRTAANGPVFTRQWGQNRDYPAPGDYDGDGKNDFVVQRSTGISGQAAFWINLSSTPPGFLHRYAVFGAPTDVIVPGDYDGDNKTDIAIVRGGGGDITWFYEPSTQLGTFHGGRFGLSAADTPVQGDYDGDGRTDFAVFRPNTDPAQNFFYVRKSVDGSLLANEWGQNGDYPAANYNYH